MIMTTYSVFIKDVFLDTIWQICYFPVWWYSQGLKKTALFCWQRVKDGWRVLALLILIKSFFKPMYAQTGWAAYALSLNTHFWQIIWRSFLMTVWVVFWLLVLLGWLILPIFVIWQLV